MSPEEILRNCKCYESSDIEISNNSIVRRFGNPNQSIYIDESKVKINGIQYENPLIFPLYDKHLKTIQCAVLQDEKPVQIIPDGHSKGFAYYGDLKKDKPVIIARALEEFFKLAQTGYAVVLVEIGEIANPKELGNIIYMLANGSGKGRMTKQITAKATYKWKVLFLSSGEKSLKEIMLEQGQKAKLGQEIRLADIDIDQSEYGIFDCIDFAENGAKQAVKLNKRINDCYGVAGIRWLEYLTNDKSRLMDVARDLLEAYREALIDSNTQGHITRVANYFALVATAGELATKANITGWKTGTAFNAVQKVFNQWLNGFEQVGDYEHREMINHVKAFFEANESSRFEAIATDSNEKIHNRVGYWKVENNKTKSFYIFPEQFKNEVCKGFDSRKVARALLAEGLLEHDVNKTTKTVRVPCRKVPIRVYVVKESIFS